MLSVHLYSSDADHVRASLRALDPERPVFTLRNRRELQAALPAIEVLLAGVPPRDGWAGATALRMIHVMGVGVDMLLPSADLPESVVIANARGLFAAESAEFAIAMLLALVRDVPRIVEQARDRRFVQFASSKLEGSTLGILGLGEIGRRVATNAKGLGMNVLGVSRSGRVVPGTDETHRVSEIDSVLTRSQHLVVALPKTSETANLLDARRLSLLPHGARLVVISRGGIVDEGALVRALEEGRLLGAALDVFAHEPLVEASPLWTAPKMIVSPHVAGVGHRYVDRVVELFIENLALLERGEPIRTPVDRRSGY